MGHNRLGGNDSDRIKGFILFNEIEYPFLYSDNVLEIFPQSKQIWHKTLSSFWDEFPVISEDKKFVGTITLIGKTSFDKDVMFEVSEQHSNENGFIYFNVKSLFIYNDKDIKYSESNEGVSGELLKSEKQNYIRGIILNGREIDYYYDSSFAFSQIVNFSEDRKSITSMQVNTNPSDEKDCGTMRWDNIDINIKIRTVAVMKPRSPAPLSGRTDMIFEFSRPVGISFVKKIFISVYTCFGYLSRRTNIKLDPINIFDLIENKRNVFGEYTINLGRDTNESHKEAKSRIISHQIIMEKFSILFEQFLLKNIYINNIPRSVDATHKYRPDRIIFNFVAFEREYRNLYKENLYRSNEYLDAKNSVLQAIDNIVGSSTGKRKKYLNGFKKSIERTENSFGDRLGAALNDYELCLKPFLIQNHGAEYKSKIDDVCIRMNQLRNDSAHGNIDLEILPEHISDFATLEELLYAMRLKSIGLSDRKIQQAINDLMNCNIYIPNEESSEKETI